MVDGYAFLVFFRGYLKFVACSPSHGPSSMSDNIASDMKTTLRNFQRQFAAMRAQADAGETVQIESGGVPRYIFKLSRPAAREPLSRLLARATNGLELRRDKRPTCGA